MIDFKEQMAMTNRAAPLAEYEKSYKNASPALGKKVAGGVGVSGRASDSGVAIYSQRKKISNAYGVKNRAEAAA